MSLAKRNVLLLAASQAMMQSAIVMSMALAAILGSALAPDKSLATLPVAAMVIGTALTSLPAAMLMRRIGRRAGFLIGAGVGVAGSVLAAAGLQQQSFVIFVFAHLLLGSYQGFANYYRFAAAEAVAPDHVSRAIAWVVAGGIVAAFLGPQLGQWGRDWLIGSGLFVGSFVAQASLSLIALMLLAFVQLKPVAIVSGSTARPLREILAQPALRASVFGAGVGYAVMLMVMTATPLAILGCGLPTANITPVIQWHVVGMFAPSFFTGNLIKRYGAPRIMRIGFILLLGHVTITLLGAEFLHFLSALILLGVGWNFAFIGGTTLLTTTYRPAEQFKVQAINEFSIAGLVAFATLSSGWLYDRFGWITLNLSVVPFLLLALLAVISIEKRMRLADTKV
jgi:MFS family permease